jgi:hypothetical protein
MTVEGTTPPSMFGACVLVQVPSPIAEYFELRIGEFIHPTGRFKTRPVSLPNANVLLRRCATTNHCKDKTKLA